jgi:Xaa-Pro aminopeptidase
VHCRYDPAVPDVLIVADTLRSPELRHEVPVAIGDPFVYLERDGTRHLFVSSFEIPRLEELGGLQIAPFEAIGIDELIASGMSWREMDPELALRACKKLEVDDAVAPPGFPLDIADHLRAGGVRLVVDRDLFELRRRVKTGPELAGVRRAQRACEQAMEAVREGLRAGPGVTCEELQATVLRVFAAEGVLAEDVPIVSHGAQTAIGHEVGHGEIEAGEAVVVDLFPRDAGSGCFADMTRTFCSGEPSGELVEYQHLCREALERVVESVRPEVTGAELHRRACELFEAHGYRTQLTKKPGEPLAEGFYHSLGHGVGLEVHEPPWLHRIGTDPLVPGDVLAIEPGLYRPGFGGCRLEDLVLVTEDGCEVLTDFPYDLAP